MSNMITAQNAPRDVAELQNLTKTVKYRLGLSLNMWGGDKSAEEAFLIHPTEGQAAALLTALQQYDAAQGGAAPVRAAQTPAAMPPPMAAPAHLQAPGSFQTPAQAPPAPIRQPQTTSDPGPTGFTQANPPVTRPGPGAGVGAGAGPQLLGAITKLYKMVEEDVAGAGDLEEIKEVVLGIAFTQRTLAVLCFLLAENQFNMSKEGLIRLIESELKEDSIDKLFTQEDSEGKG